MFDGYAEVTEPTPLRSVLAPSSLRRRTSSCPPGVLLADLLDEGRLLAEYPSAQQAWADGEARAREAEGAMIDRTAGWDQLTAWSEASKMYEIAAAVERAVSQVECRPESEKVWTVENAVGSLVHDFALAWRVHSRTASHRVDEAVNLVHRCPLVIRAMMRGDITLAHARAVADVLLRLEGELADRVAAELLDGDARDRTPAQLAAAAQRIAHRLDPGAAARRHGAARKERRVELRADEDGMATVTVYLPAAEALTLYRTVDAHARRCQAEGLDGESRSMNARRADSAVDLVARGALLTAGATPVPDEAGEARDTTETAPAPCRCPDEDRNDEDREPEGADPADSRPPDADDSTEPAPGPATPGPATPGPATPEPTRHGSAGRRRSETPLTVDVRVVASADTLLGLDEAPAELVGYGPITAAEARRLAAGRDATWMRVLTDPESGTVLDVGHTRYRPPPSMAEHVRSRDVTCYFPGCRLPARACDLDHVIAYRPAEGTGPTAVANLRPACRHHHRIKQLPGWTVRPLEGDGAEWTTPSGHRYRLARSPLLPTTVVPARADPRRPPVADGAGDDVPPF